MRGVRLVVLDRHSDPRGSLFAFDGDTGLPFEVKNVYFIADCPSKAVRGEHAVSDFEAFIAVNSAVTADLDNGSEQKSMRLAGPDRALLIAPGVWIRLREFTPQTTIVVLAARAHEEMERFLEPQPRLVEDAES